MGKSQSSVREFAFIGFLLLAVLFGMQIMSFIFGNLETVTTDIADLSSTVTNESGGWVNITPYTVAAATNTANFTSLTVTAVWGNATDSTAFLIPAANYTVDSVAGTIVNATVVAHVASYNDANVSYDYTYKSQAELISEGINNDSLQAIGNYATQAGTQFTTLGVAITLVVLVAVFIFFWVAFMGRRGKKSGGQGSIGAGEGSF